MSVMKRKKLSHRLSCFAAPAMLALFCCYSTAAATIANEPVFIDMVQNNPGDAVGWEQTKYFDAEVLAGLNFTGQTTTGEMAGTQAIAFDSLGLDLFPSGSANRQWLDAYKAGVHGFVDRAVAAGLTPYFFVDMLVFPVALLRAWPNATADGSGTGKIAWNDATRQLVRVLIAETISEFPSVGGWIVRTGETYTYDTPYHVGNSPSNGTADGWVDFITFLRDELCERAGKQLFMRAWDNWPSDAAYYSSMTGRIAPHDKLYFSIKHSSSDFVRPASWNPTLGIGKHAQIVEVELQREYEGKGAFPNYVMDGVINGFPEMRPVIGIASLLQTPQLRGVWTWTRGGGWWGPYLHGNEIWVDLHAQTIARWWSSQTLMQACEALFRGCTGANGCCRALRTIVQAGANSVLTGQWGTIHSPGDWMRDDRIGGLPRTEGHWGAVAKDEKLFAASLEEKSFAKTNFEAAWSNWTKSVRPHLTSRLQADKVGATIKYGVLHFTVVDAAWRAMGQGYKKQKGIASFDAAALAAAIKDYDAAFAAYRAFGLADVFAPSLYHPYYLCLGTHCNCALDPPSNQTGDSGYGIGATIDSLRKS